MASGHGKVVAALAGGLAAGLVLGFLAGSTFHDDAPGAAGEGPTAATADARDAEPRAGGGGADDADGPRGAAAGPSRRATETRATRGSEVVGDRVARSPRAPGGDAPGREAGPGEGGGRGAAGGARGERRASPTAAGPAAPTGPRPPAESSGPALADAQGVVVDAVTQQPIEGARVLYAMLSGRTAGSWTGDTTDAAGRFRHHVADPADLAGATAEIRVSKDGYETLRVAPSPGEMRIELRVRGVALLPGRVTGVVRDADGKPVAGEVEIEGYDEQGSNAAQRTIADAAGGFVLEGVPAGSWQFLWAGGPEAAVVVPDGGEVRAELRARGPGDRPGLVVTDVDPSKVDAGGGAAAAQLRELLGLLERVDAAPDLDAGTRERLRLSLAQEVQRLAETVHAALPRREVVVTGLGVRGRAWLRLELKPRQFWRVEATGGTARFVSVAVGSYTAVLTEPGKPDRTAPVVVTPGEGPQSVPFAE
jgi:hypothetical protein